MRNALASTALVATLAGLCAPLAGAQGTISAADTIAGLGTTISVSGFASAQAAHVWRAVP